jgi:osmotically-inducible protein OsmY
MTEQKTPLTGRVKKGNIMVTLEQGVCVMRIARNLAIVFSVFLLGACAYHRAPVVYTTPGGQVISAGPDARTAADRALETSVRAELNRYGDLASANLNLQAYANRGTVTLSGLVRNDRDRQMIDTLVRDTPGVTGVNDQLQVLYPPTGVVTPPPYSQTYTTPAPIYPPAATTVLPAASRIEAERVADQPLAQRIAEQLRFEGVPSGWLDNVSIRVRDGAAYVQGYVASQREREAIDAAVQHTRGVTVVYDQLQFH